MAWMCARYAFQVLVATSLVVMLSAWPLAAQEGDGEASSEEPRFDVFWGGGVSFAEDLGIPFTLDAGVTAWLWDWWGGTWGGGAWFTGMPAVNQGSVTLALRRGYSLGSRGHFQLGAALLRRRPKGLLPAARQELLDPSKAWWGGRRGRLADRPRYSISVSLGVVPLVLPRRGSPSTHRGRGWLRSTRSFRTTSAPTQLATRRIQTRAWMKQRLGSTSVHQ